MPTVGIDRIIEPAAVAKARIHWRLETRMEVSYWARALSSDNVLRVERKESGEFRERIAALVREAQDRGELSTRSSAVATHGAHRRPEPPRKAAPAVRDPKELQTGIIGRAFAALAREHLPLRAGVGAT